MELRGERHRLFQPFIDKQGVAKPSLKWTNRPLDNSEAQRGFCEAFAVSDVEWETALAAWPGSERARRYGLVEERAPAFRVDSKLGAANAKKTASARRGRKQG